MTRSTLTRSVACAIACAGLSIFTRGAAAQIMSAPATPNATSGTALTDWNISYRIPANWRVGRTIGRLQMIVSNTDAGMIFLAPGMYATPQDAIADLSTFYQQMQMQAYPVEQPAMGTIAGLRSITAMYASADQMGRMVQGRYIALLTALALGDTAAALSALERSQRTSGRVWSEYLGIFDRAYDPVRRSPRFIALVKQANLDMGRFDQMRRGR